MTYQPVPIALKQGLNTTTPSLMAEPGTLIDCLNYEMTTDIGYRRIDGFESYDGWANGVVADYYKVAVNITDNTILAELVPGATIFQTSSTVKSVALGTVISYSGGVLTYLPAFKSYPIIPSGTALDTIYYSGAGGVSRMATTAAAQSGLSTDSASTFVANCRSYSTTLRNLVQSYQTPVAGVYWFRNNLVLALDCPVLMYNDTTTASSVQEGYQISYQGLLYKVIDRSYSSPKMTLHLEPLGNASTNTSTIKVEGWTSTISTVTGASSISLTYGSSAQAYFVSANNIQTATSRGTTSFNRSVIVSFTGGVAAAEAKFVPGGLVSVGASNLQYSGAYVKNCVVTSGTFAANNAAGYLEVILHGSLGFTGNINYIDNTMQVRSFSGGGTVYATITTVTRSKVAGTSALLAEGTRYQWGTYNFYGQDSDVEAYGCTGASRAFWLHAYTDPLTKAYNPSSIVSLDPITSFSWGSIVTDIAATSLDVPRYLAYHGGRLALGFSGGSVELSVPGEPRNFDGFNGADEIATGDHITGLVDATGDSLIVFGRRSIRRITGVISADLSLQTISGNAGAYDYTCVLVGNAPVFTGPNGVSTLEQTAAYGDFAGDRLSTNVDITLNPLLVTDNSRTQVGGAAMALPVRGKNQYRLWLSTGEVYTFTLTHDGCKIMRSNYGLGTDIRVPFAWCSETGDGGMERIFVVWDKDRASKSITNSGAASTLPDEKRIYQMDAGWGFDGKTFSSYIELAHIFSPTQEMYTSIGKVRLMGYGYGLATLDLKSSGIESDFNQAYHSAVQDISLPASLTTFTRNMQPVMAIVDQASWGLGVKLKIQGSQQENLTTTEPSHVCQVLVIYLNTEGVTTQ